jgi:hypothetical protein
MQTQFAKRFTPASTICFTFGIADIALGECCFSVSGVYFVGYGLSVFSFTSDKINEAFLRIHKTLQFRPRR